ncbi:2-hydroxy-3-oxopropionate reductase [Leptolyngbya sp. FACHB-321]|uniref:2-hydroxy-3-oxopropionate reductase n=1 Tax=Leptolyngbya sp. FACHB-321 TaxID=2692807 RepID=UPI00168930A1|nr:2-hydroxy-3-oxopropionate reductase [Leptolyngbya sp. FACHB-321]MBD2034779.1 2-hydroxy-3-oxopropionate reductase [Leptolyngbya sp. FACHB-321]
MQPIGFIGLGIMGKPMARNLLKAGYPLVVYNRSRPAMEALAAEGAVLADSPKAVAEQVDVVISCVSDSPDVEAVALGSNGIIEGAKPGLLYVDMSTIAPATARQVYTALKVKGVDALDAPVSGGDIGAQQGTLSIMVGGDEPAFQRSLPILQAMGKNIVYIGEAGAGQVTKACNQIVVALTVQAVAEALTLAKKSGVDVARVREALMGGFAQSRVLDVHGKRILEGDFQPGFKLVLHRKDMNIVLQTGRETGVPLFGSAQVTSMMDALLAQGKGDLDNAALVTLYELLAAID